MKRYVIVCLLTAHMLLLALPCLAGERAGALSISPFAGGYSFDGMQHLRTQPVYGLRIGYDITKNWATEVVADYVTTTSTLTSQGFDIFSYRLDVLYNFMPEHALVPYLAIGGGGSYKEPKTSREFNDLTANVGGGLKYFITDSFAFRADVRQLFVFGGEETLYDWEYTAGLSFLFGGRKPAAPMAEPGPIAKRESESVTAPALEPPLEPVPATEPTGRTTKYCVTLNIMFDIDTAIIREESRDEIARVGKFMQKYPSTTAVIEGHSDDVGSDDYTLQLSQIRAERVVDYLADDFGIARSRLSAVGYGKTRPIASNSTEAGRQKNRRIEAIIDCAVDIKGLKPVPDRLCLNLKIEFDTDKAAIKPQSHDELAKVADFMKENPTVTGLVEGHTDNVGNPDYNMKLSQRRAESVVDYLVEKFGIERSRLSAKGYGDTRRVAYNSTPEGRAKNRRVNLILDCATKK